MRMGVDHGITQPYQVLYPAGRLPVVPIMVNCSASPRPSLRRSYELGAAVRTAIEEIDLPLRVMVLGSGGLSHWVNPMQLDGPDVDEAKRNYLISGRDEARRSSAAREAVLAQRIRAGHTGKVNPEWDQAFLADLAAGDFDSIVRQEEDTMEATAGNGSHEIRSWLAAAGAVGRPIEVLAYEPVPTWVTGMGIVAAIA
jgi:2,3-dihydroxyphenylpropionate 1,2-dioxygenase